MSKIIQREVVYVEKRHWDIDDDYLVIPEIQVFDLKEGDKVVITIEKEEIPF